MQPLHLGDLIVVVDDSFQHVLANKH